MRTLSEYRAHGRDVLKQAGIESSSIDADLLLIHAAKIDLNTLLTDVHTPVCENAADVFLKLLEQRRNYTPIQHILGKCEFMSLDFAVTADVLIPRPDTEILVEVVLALAARLPRPLYGLEIGTGSGCISIALAHHAANITMLGVDISLKALRVAEQNRADHGLDSKVELIQSDLFEDVPRGTPFDLIISNPPYIKTSDIGGLGKSVKNYEPYLALDGGMDGLEFYRRIACAAPDYLCEGGSIFLEIGHDQGGDVTSILAAAGFVDIEVVQDLTGKDRVVRACLA